MPLKPEFKNFINRNYTKYACESRFKRIESEKCDKLSTFSVAKKC